MVYTILKKSLLQNRNFISHIFQMKLFIRKLLSSKEIVFISHMVQMKLSSGVIVNSLKNYLYPTWFRWN